VAQNKYSASYPDLTLLGSSEAAFPESPEQAKLESFPNPRPKRDYWIHLHCLDFTSLCPVTGQPDFAEIRIDYIPDRLCIETKSLKLYLAAYRNVRSFNEEVVNRILDDLVTGCRPRRMKVEGKFAARGGLALTVAAEHPDSRTAAEPPGSDRRE
jgi:7-cyano-7-deazaguanine reductase